MNLSPEAQLHFQLIDKINQLRPGAVFTLRGNTYEGLDWLDENQAKPTAEELGL